MKFITGFVFAVVLTAAGFVSYLAYQDHKLVKASALYLFADTNVKGQDGKPLTRADIIDAILKDVIQRADAVKK